MLAAVKGYCDGNQIILNENDRNSLSVGDELIITILDRIDEQKEARAEKRRRLIESGAFVVSSGRTAKDINEYIQEMRTNDRL